MLNLNAVGAVLKATVEPVMAVRRKRAETQAAVATMQAQASAARDAGETEIRVNASQWELLALRQQDNSWKDEFVTVLVFAPFLTSMVGAVAAAFGFPRILEASTIQFQAIADMGIDYGALLMITICAALALRAVKP